MDNSDVIDLLTVEYDVDASGTEQPRIVKRRQVFCQISSIGIKEVYAALAVNHHPEIRATIAEFADYEGETFAVYRGSVFKVLRTYQRNLSMELTLERTNDLRGIV